MSNQTNARQAHTPGPWTAVYNNAYQASWLIQSSDGNKISQVANWQNASFNVDADANARLIAAAPDLLQSLRGLIGTCEMQGVDYDQPDMQAARAAIAKATGENPA